MISEAPDNPASQETESLVKRLAGPSTGKAGLAKDQTEINRIISEASKGSKFYENEKKKDKDLTARIDRILKQRDDALLGVDLSKVEISVDHLLAELESARDLSQTIVHVDMDAFYANVELLHNPDLIGKPFGVGRGVLTTASYEARKYGVRSGMPGFIAQKLCPDLIIVPNHFARYLDMSKTVMSIFERYDPTMSADSCDEGYLNITAYCREHGLSAEDCVQQMRNAVQEETKLTVSAGIAANKMLAKICSDKNKPNGQFQLPFDKESITSFMHDLSIRKIPGIGRVNERLLESIGIKTCGDIFTHRAVISLMDKQFGHRFLLRTYLGIASNLVQPHQRDERKSIGAERTFTPLDDKVKILQKLKEVAAELEKDMIEGGWTGRTVTLKYKLDTYQVFTRAKSFDRWISTAKEDLYATGKELLKPELPLSLRLIGLRVTKLKDLRAQPTPSNGIKRFFEPIQPESPRKRTKLDNSGADRGRLNNLDENSAQDHGQDHDDLDETMPGFHEHDERDNDMSAPYLNDDLDIPEIQEDEKPPKPRPPLSASATWVPGATRMGTSHVSAASTLTVPKPASEPHSTSDDVRPSLSTEALNGAQKAMPTAHDCPVCGKTLETDNRGLNAHIDFCLSRGAIRRAHAEASSPVKKSAPDKLQWPKTNRRPATESVQWTRKGKSRK